ncbi:MAG: hypothetical protein HOQ32_10315 [Lysobacter sp.]|nr:hypothetical protein [Lysobacter sp.]
MTKFHPTCFAAALAFASVVAAPAQAATLFSTTSQPGDPVGLGQSAVYTDADASLTLDADARSIRLMVSRDDDSWYVSLGAPRDRKFEVGRYYDAENPTRRTGRAPYVYLANNGRRCDDAWGEIHIQQLELDADERVVALEATVLQHCNSADAPVLAAVIRHNVEPLSLKIDSDPGDVVGEGLQKSYYGDTSVFELWGGGQSAMFNAHGQRDYWRASLFAPYGQTLQVGTYAIGDTAPAGSAVFVFERPSRPCMRVSSGTLRIEAVEYDPDGVITGLHAQFEQHCDGAAEALRGTIRYRL